MFLTDDYIFYLSTHVPLLIFTPFLQRTQNKVTQSHIYVNNNDKMA